MSNISEQYLDNYSWSQYVVQCIFYAIFPRFTEQRVDAAIKYEQDNKIATEAPSTLRTKYEISFLEGAKCRTHVIAPLHGEADIIIFYYHGGAYVSNLMSAHFTLADAILQSLGTDGLVYMLEYPLVPSVNHETLFPIIEDVYRQVLLTTRPTQKIVLMGDSTGGGIALVLAQRLVAAKIGGDAIRQPDSVVLLSPWLDVSMSYPECATYTSVDPILSVGGLRKAGELLADGIELTHPAVSPLYGPLEGLPPTSVFTSTHDTLCPDARRLRDRFKQEGISSTFHYYEKRGLLHCFFLFPGTGTAETIQEITDALRADCANSKDADQRAK